MLELLAQNASNCIYTGGVRPNLGKAHAWAIVGRNNKLKYCFFPSTYLHISKIYSRGVRVPDISEFQNSENMLK